MLEYPTMAMTKRRYRQSKVKVKEYMTNSNRVRRMRARPIGWSRHYGISEGSPIRTEHLLAICLYCDYTELCTIFSESFREIESEEDLEVIKARNRRFWWMSKYLREAVQLFGGSGSGDKKIRGPFYCGVSFEAVVDSFYISLKGPTSTTTVREVAMNFGGESGIILKLNNRREPGKYTRLLDMQWISSYAEEAERLFFAGDEPLQLMSITNVNTGQHHESVIWPLHWFDFFLSENWISHLLYERRRSKEGIGWWNEKDVKVILDLMDYADTNNAKNTRFSQYVLDIFDRWRFNKKKVVIAPWKFDQPEAKFPTDLLNVIFHSLSNGTFPSAKNPRINLLTQRVLNLFPELESIEVSDYANYQFSLPLFIDILRGLQSVKLDTFQKCEIKAKWIRVDTTWFTDFECPFDVKITENKYGFRVLSVEIHSFPRDIEAVD